MKLPISEQLIALIAGGIVATLILLLPALDAVQEPLTQILTWLVGAYIVGKSYENGKKAE